MPITWAGRQWHPHDLPPSAAAAVSRLASTDPVEHMPAAVDIIRSAGLDVEEVIDVAFTADGDLDVLDLVAGILRTGTARPWRSTVGLCRTTVTQWSAIRGRLIEKGIPDPLRSLRSLTALLDVVETMILDGAKDDKDRERLIRDLYPTDVDSEGAPIGWEDGADGFDGLL